ncbi:hypothetical protein BC827DRAFT_920216 [Russula dissimulans]|nr:hypothetical protein BC827DRAFT_920216 [Russula dissimulans]
MPLGCGSSIGRYARMKRKAEVFSSSEEEGEGEGHVHERRGSSTTLRAAISASSPTRGPQRTSPERFHPASHPLCAGPSASASTCGARALSQVAASRSSTLRSSSLGAVSATSKQVQDAARQGRGRESDAARMRRHATLQDPYARSPHSVRLVSVPVYLPSVPWKTKPPMESIVAETIQTPHALARVARKLDFALCAHTKVRRLGDRVVRPPHVYRALELSGGARLSKQAHF